MCTSFALVALTGLLPLSGLNAPSWQSDYFAARKEAVAAGKPVAVVFGSGPAGHAKVAREGLNAATRKALADNYICCYVDVSTPTGQQLAKAFEITKGVGLVLSDRTGKVQAFHTDGDLSVGDLRRCLERFADPNVVVQTTVTDVNTRTSSYPAQPYTTPYYGQPYAPYQQFAPSFQQFAPSFQPSFGGGGRGC
jgi:hypothetical protein